MSEENVEVVRAAYADFAVGGVDEFIEHWADDLEHRSIEGAPDDRGPIHGKVGMRGFIEDWTDTFDDFRIEIVELIDVGGDKVVAVLRISGMAKRSRIETDQTFGVVFVVRDGKIARGREYTDRTEALEAAGLSE